MEMLLQQVSGFPKMKESGLGFLFHQFKAIML